MGNAFFLIGDISSNGGFSIAMLVSQRESIWICQTVKPWNWTSVWMCRFCGRNEFLELAQGCRFEAGKVAWTSSKECAQPWKLTWNLTTIQLKRLVWGCVFLGCGFIFWMFTPTWGHDPIWLIFFNGWNQQLGYQMEQSGCHNQTFSQLEVDAYFTLSNDRAFATLHVRLYLL